MVRYAVYDNQGNILKFGTCRERDLQLQARTGESVMEVPAGMDHFNDLDFRVVDSKLEKRPQAEIAARAAAKAERIRERLEQATKRDQVLQDIIDGKVVPGQAMIALAKVLKGEI